MSELGSEGINPWKKRLVVLAIASLSLSFPIFLVTGYTALYWAWLRGNLAAAVPYLPWARNFGMLAMVCAAIALVILFSSNRVPVSPKSRLTLSLCATVTIAFFSEFRNDGKFYFKNLIHFFGPGTWIHDALNQTGLSLGDILFRLEYSHWNDFLMGPAIVSVLFALVFFKLYGAFKNHESVSMTASTWGAPDGLDAALRFARILMNIGLFWFFIQAWGEKAGYLRNSHSSDEIDLPFEFAGTMVGFWMARVLTKPFDGRSEKFRSTLLIDFVSSGVIGLLYTLIVGTLTEHVASSVAHALSPVVPHSLEVHEYTALQRYMRPFELLALGVAMWWGLNVSSQPGVLTQLTSTPEETETSSRWDVLITIAKALGVTTGYLIVVVTMLSIIEPEGLSWMLATAAAGMVVGTSALLLMRSAKGNGLTTALGRNDKTSD